MSLFLLVIADESAALAELNLPMTVTIGVDAQSEAKTSHDELLEVADKALDKGKEAGRNRVIRAG